MASDGTPAEEPDWDTPVAPVALEEAVPVPGPGFDGSFHHAGAHNGYT